MMKRGEWRVVVLAGLVLAAVGTAGSGYGQDALKELLPPDGAAAGWVRDGEPQEFGGEDLFTYIDGGAEIYREYGFRRVVVQDYKGPAGKSISLEIFEMSAPEAAYGMYTFKRSGQGKVVSLGSEGALEDYYLNFWKGRFLVTLTGFDSDPATLAALLAVARAVDARIADKAGPPDLVAALPVTGLKPGSVKYLKGLLGLNNVYSFYTARGLGFEDAVKGEYEDGTTMIVLDYGRDEDRTAGWAELRSGLEAVRKFKSLASAGAEAPVFQDPEGRFVAFAPAGSRLLIGIGDSAPAALNRIR